MLRQRILSGQNPERKSPGGDKRVIMEAATPKKRSVSTEGETMTVGRTKKSTDPCRRSWHGLLVLIMTAALISNSSLRADAASSEGTYIADEIMISSVIKPIISESFLIDFLL